MKRILSVFILLASALFAADWQRVDLAAPITFQGQSFSILRVCIQDGTTPSKPAGYIFRPAREVQPGTCYLAHRTLITPATQTAPEGFDVQARSFSSAAERDEFIAAQAKLDPPAVWKAKDDTPPILVTELGGEYFCADAAPSIANAATAITTYCNTPIPPTPIAWRVLKDTIVLRVKEAGKLTQLRQVITALSEDQRFEWDAATWFHSNTPLIVQGVQALGLDPAIILAPDPLGP